MFRMPGVFGRWRLKREAEVWGCGFNVEQGNAEGRIVKKVMRPPQRRCVVGHVMEAHRLSRSCCCSLAELSRSMAYYVSTRPYDQRLRDRLRELARFHRRFGYLRLHYLLRREGLVVIPKRTYRLYREERLQIYKRKARKRFKRERVPLKPADGLKQIWLLDFIMGQSVHVAYFRTLNLGGDFSRQNRGILVDFSISGERMARFLDELAGLDGYPEEPVIGNGPECTSKAMFLWSERTGV